MNQPLNNSIHDFLHRCCPPPLFTDAGWQEIIQHLSVVKQAKGHSLIREGSTHPFAYFLLQGAARSFYLKDGTEVNTWFAFENETVGSFQNYQNQPARESVELLEDSQLIVMDLHSLRKALPNSLQISHFVRLAVEEYTAFLEERLYLLQFMNGMERYLFLLENEPHVLQRVPLTYIASYLGMSRETLSRLRARTQP